MLQQMLALSCEQSLELLIDELIEAECLLETSDVAKRNQESNTCNIIEALE